MRTARPSADAAKLAFHVENLLVQAQAQASAAMTSQLSLEPLDSISMYSKADLERYTQFWAASGGEGSQNAKQVLARLEQAGSDWPLSPLPTDSGLQDLAVRYPNFNAPVEYVRRAVALARLAPARGVRLAPLLLDGPPGIGKSSFARALAKAMFVPTMMFSMTQATSSFGLGGLNAQYAGGGPGYLVRTLTELAVPDALVIIDEIDKAPLRADFDPTRPLYELLEPSTSSKYVDDGLRMPLNLSALKWVCTCNDVELVPAPLRSRCKIFAVPAPSKPQLRQIALNVYRELIKGDGFSGHFDQELPDEVLTVLSDGVPRDLMLAFRDALGSAALEGRRVIRASDIASSLQQRRCEMGFL